MTGTQFRRMLKPWMLPIAMTAGVIFHESIHYIAFLTPYLIFVMLLITFCRIDPRHIRFDGMTAKLIAVQLFVSLGVYLLLLPFDEAVAQGAFICIFCPTATAAPVVTAMLGGSLPKLVSFSLVSNVTVALTAPIAFTLMGTTDINFITASSTIASRVAPLIILPLVTALIMRRVLPKAHRTLAEHQSLSFYVWAVSLLIVVGNSVSFIMKEPPEALPSIIWLAAVAALACAFQFIAGSIIGIRSGDRISGAQGLGQKNTVLAIWMAMTYLIPLSSVAPAAYVAWQNTVNSLQLYFRQRRLLHADAEKSTEH